MTLWRSLLLVYRELRVDPWHHRLTEPEVEWALASFRGLPLLVSACSEGAAALKHDIVHCQKPLTSLTKWGDNLWWPSPADTQQDFRSGYHSVFVLWPQNQGDSHVPCGGWGLAVGPGEWTRGATYAAVANAAERVWKNEAQGEVWLHEWLHGVCDHVKEHGADLPVPDADGGGAHGYKRHPKRGWCDYYRDLMTGRVKGKGITRRDWALGPPPCLTPC
jgi:hypothetical protein